MKKFSAIFFLFSLIAALLSICYYTYEAGRYDGITYAFENVEIWTVERYNPENPYENTRPDGTDQTVYLTIDNATYEKGMYQG